MNQTKQNIQTQFYLGDTLKEAELNLLDLHPNIFLSEIIEEFKLLVSKELKKAKSNKLSLEVINGNSFFRYQLDKREFFVSSKNSKEIYFDRSEIISTLMDNSGIDATGQVNVIKMIESNSILKSNLLANIEKYLRKYIALKNEEDYIVLAAYIVLTYVFSSFQAIPYLRIKGNKGS